MALSKQIKHQVRIDKAKWFDDVISKGDWNAIKVIRSKSKRQLVTLQDEHATIVSTEHRAETLASYFERVQWAVSPTTLFDDALTSRTFDIGLNCCRITFIELREAVVHLKNNKQCGADDVPGEFWKICCLPGSPTCD